MFTNFTKFALSLAAWIFLISNLVLGQIAPTGTVTGHMRGPGGVSVPGATVQLTNPQTGERKETWTDEAGNYTFAGLAPGDYRLAVSLIGFRPDSREPLPVASEKTLKVNVALVFSTPDGAAQQQAQAARPAGTRANVPGGVGGGPGGTPSLGDAANRGPGASLRIAEGNGAEGQGFAQGQRQSNLPEGLPLVGPIDQGYPFHLGIDQPDRFPAEINQVWQADKSHRDHNSGQ